MAEQPDEQVPGVGDAWTPEEVSLIVTDYFAMLRRELAGQPYSKTQHRQALAGLMPGRSHGSIEFKHQNISAVLIDMGLPYIDGYKPRWNFQRLLADRVQDYIEGRPHLIEEAAQSPRLDVAAAPVAPPLEETFEPPPDRIIIPEHAARDWRQLRSRRIDFARRDADNRRLGALGEQFVVELERRRLQQVGRDDLAARVEWVARDYGDGAGFDVLSFDEHDDTEQKLEVKTTGLGKFFPFYVTAGEVACSTTSPRQYQLYRVFDFSARPRVYVLRGALPDVCTLAPTVYRASL